MDKGSFVGDKIKDKKKSISNSSLHESHGFVFSCELNILHTTGIQPVSATYIRFRTVLLQVLSSGTDTRF